MSTNIPSTCHVLSIHPLIYPLTGHVRRMKQLRLERPTTDSVLEGFLHRHQIMTRFQHDPQRNRQETLSSLKQLAEWFRSEFPYYYQSCLHCGHRDDNMCYGLVFPSIGTFTCCHLNKT